MKYVLLSLIGISLLSVSCSRLPSHKGDNKSFYLQELLPRLEQDLEFTGDPGENTKSPILNININNESYCTAFVISNRYALTAAHCVLGRGNELVVINKAIESGVTARIVAYNEGNDIAVLMGSFLEYKKLPVDLVDPPLTVLSSPLLVSCGYPWGQKEFKCVPINAGGVAAFTLIGSGELYPGMSGGPVIDPLKGVVIALNHGVSTEQPNLVYLAPLVGILGVFELE